MSYKIISLEERYDLFERQDKICKEVWPEFMLHDAVANTYWMKFIETFKEYQLLIMDGKEIFAVINTVPMHFDKSINELSDGRMGLGCKEINFRLRNWDKAEYSDGSTNCCK